MIAKLMRLKTISPKRLNEKLGEKNLFIYDLNSIQSYQLAHVPGAVHANQETFSRKDLPDNKDAELIFYCSNPLCRKAPNAAKLAIKSGYDNAQVLMAGISGWANKKMPVESL
tara:strand:+ start:72831 stop:73169 length:339 start_codon:yes stop_codon:yes gene_type:complete